MMRCIVSPCWGTATTPTPGQNGQPHSAQCRVFVSPLLPSATLLSFCASPPQPIPRLAGSILFDLATSVHASLANLETQCLMDRGSCQGKFYIDPEREARAHLPLEKLRLWQPTLRPVSRRVVARQVNQVQFAPGRAAPNSGWSSETNLGSDRSSSELGTMLVFNSDETDNVCLGVGSCAGAASRGSGPGGSRI